MVMQFFQDQASHISLSHIGSGSRDKQTLPGFFLLFSAAIFSLVSQPLTHLAASPHIPILSEVLNLSPP